MSPRDHRIRSWLHVAIAALLLASLILAIAAANWTAACSSFVGILLALHVASLYRWPVHVRVSRPSSNLTVHVSADTTEFRKELASLERRVKALDGSLRRASGRKS